MNAPAIPNRAQGGRDIQWDVAELRRRLDNVVRVAVVAEVDAAALRLRARWATDADGAPVLSGWLPWVAARAGEGASEWWAPEVGERVLLLAPGGDLAAAAALPALYSDATPPPSKDAGRRVSKHADGAVIEYDADAHALKATLPAGATASIDADGGVDIVGDVTVRGDVAVEGGVSASGDVAADGDVSDARGDMQEMRDAHNRHLHPAGSPPGNTGPTTRRMT